MKQWVLWLIGGSLALGVAVKLGIGHPREAIVDLDTAKPVAVAVAKRENLVNSISLSAELRPFEEIDVHAKESGYLKTLSVDIGDKVKSGQVIATLDINELKADADHANAAYRDAKLEYGRIAVVSKKRPGLLAQEEVDKSEAVYEMAKANAERAKTLLDYATITVPFDGVVTKRYADPGALIQAGSGSGVPAMAIVHIADTDTLRLIFPVPESAVPRIHNGTPVEVTIDATGQKMTSLIVRTAGKIDSATRTMETEVDLDNRTLRVTPGMYAIAVVHLDQKNDALVLPVQAVATGDKPNVWVVNTQHEIEERPVTLGLQTPDAVEIVSGLGEGEEVVFGSRGALILGMKVVPKPVNGKGNG